MSFQILYKHGTTRRPAFGLQAFYQGRVGATGHGLLPSDINNWWTDSLGILTFPGNFGPGDSVYAKIRRPGTTDKHVTLHFNDPLEISLDFLSPTLAALRTEFSTPGTDFSRYATFCGHLVSDYLAKDAIARILWAPDEALACAWHRFTDNPGLAYSPIVVATATTLFFEVIDGQNSLSQNALNALTCLDATLDRLESLEAAGGRNGYLLRWARAGVGTNPDVFDWSPAPGKPLLGPCDIDYCDANVGAEPSQDEYTGYAVGLGLATKLLRALDLNTERMAPLRKTRQRLAGLFERCMTYLVECGYTLTRPCAEYPTVVSRGASAFPYSWAFKAARHMALGTGKLNYFDGLEQVGAASPGLVLNSITRAFATRWLLIQNSSQGSCYDWLVDSIGQVIGYSLLAALKRSTLWRLTALLDSVGWPSGNLWFNRAMQHRLSMAAYEDDVVWTSFLTFQAKDAVPVTGKRAPIYAPLYVATRTWFGAFGRSDSGAWLDDARAQLRSFLDDPAWLSPGTDQTGEAGVRTADAANAYRPDVGGTPNIVANGTPDRDAQQETFNRFDSTLLAQSILSLALDLPPPFDWTRAAAAVRKVTA